MYSLLTFYIKTLIAIGTHVRFGGVPWLLVSSVNWSIVFFCPETAVLATRLKESYVMENLMRWWRQL